MDSPLAAQPTPTPAPPLGDPPKPELSPYRVSILVLVLVLVAAVFMRFALDPNSTGKAALRTKAAYAPYVDVTQTPIYPFQSATAAPVAHVYLAFIVASPGSPCTPSWGGYYTLGQAAHTLNLDSRIAEVRSQGGGVYVSFGGERNSELALGCRSVTQLTRAYRTVVSRYHTDTVDFDVEGAALNNLAADQRRARAVAALQHSDRHLQVWMTLPVTTTGLTAEDIAAIRPMLTEHVRLAGVNIMALDFGPGSGAAKDMIGAVESALNATHDQVQALWQQARLQDDSQLAWQHIGVTTMIGVNDITDERFTTADAHKLRAFVREYGIARVSIWSLNRDSQCGGAFAQIGTLSANCSGVRQSPLQFTHIFSKLAGTETANRNSSSVLGIPTTTTNSNVTAANSPYPMWRSDADYTAGYKVVFEGTIYQARWYSVGTAPGSTVDLQNNPWLLIGPVPQPSSPYSPVISPAGHHVKAQWSAANVYRRGDKVLYGGLPFQAKYYTKGDEPSSQLPADPSSPWTPLFSAPHEPSAAGSA